MAQASSRRANSVLLMDPLSVWEHPDSLLGRTGVTNGDSGDRSAAPRVPAVEIAESDGNLVISAQLPGLSAEDIKVQTIGNVLIIQGERRPERGPEVRGHIGKRRPRYFYREIVLPEGADGQKASAEIRNGELRITVPLRAQVRRIPINASEGVNSATETIRVKGSHGSTSTREDSDRSR